MDLLVSDYAYDPWGSPLAAPAFEAVPEPIRYAGYWWDAELARYYCWARYYDPLLERFLSRDRLYRIGTATRRPFFLKDPGNPKR